MFLLQIDPAPLETMDVFLATFDCPKQERKMRLSIIFKLRLLIWGIQLSNPQLRFIISGLTGALARASAFSCRLGCRWGGHHPWVPRLPIALV
jgi:hypothetical protein